MESSRFDALLRDLVTFGLVEPRQRPDGRPGWQLTTETEDRLGAIQPRKASAERTVYLGRRCAQCQEIKATRSREGRYLCDTCWSAHKTETEGTAPQGAAQGTDPGK